MTDQTRLAPAAMDAPSPTTPLDHPVAGALANCLALAARRGRAGRDEAVFLSAPAGGDGPGHVVLRDAASGAVREPDEDRAAARSVEAYAAALGRRVLAVAPVSLLRELLGLAPERRAAALGAWAAPLAPVAGLAFGIVGLLPIQPKPKDQPPAGSSATDKDVHSWLDALGGAVSDGDKKDLAQTGDDATTLLNWFDAHKRNDPDIDKKMPQNVKDAEGRLLANASVADRLNATPDSGTLTVTRDTLGSFVKDIDDAANAAKGSWGDYQKADKSPDPATLRMAADASILQADLPVLDAASPGAKVDGMVDVDDLKAAASGGDAQLPSALKDAAALYAQPGMFAMLDSAGLDMTSSHDDGLADKGNIGSFISQQLGSATPAQLGEMLSEAADRSAVAGIDISKLGPDVFANPQNYSGAQKAAVMQQLTEDETRVSAGVDESDWDQYEWSAKGFNGDPNQVKADLNTKISQLSSDPDVQKFMSDSHAGTLQGIVAADPGLKDRLQSFYDGDLQSGQALNDALNGKDSDGNKVSTEVGLQSFVQTANTLNLALGQGGKPLPALDLQSIAQKSGQQGALQQAYTADILSGNTLRDEIDGGTDVGTAVQDFTRDAANFGAVLPADFVSAHAQQLTQTLSDTVSDGLLGNATTQDVTTAFCDADGNLDTQKLTDAITQAVEADPDLTTASDGTKVAPDKIVAAVASVVTDVRNGVKLQDALAKLAKAQNSDNPTVKPPTGAVADAYNKGLLHAVGALFNAGVMIAKGSEASGKGVGAVLPGELSSGLQLFGGVLEAGSKYMKATATGSLTGDELKAMEGAGKALGGAGGVLGGVLGIFTGAESVKAGDPAEGGVSIANGITGLWSGAASAIEGGASVIEAGAGEAFGGAVGADVAADLAAAAPALAATSATLGLVSAVTLPLSLMGLGIYAAVEGMKRVQGFENAAMPELQQFGITGGTGASNDPPEDPPPPVEP